jgi:hypothetical protein
MTTPAMIRTMKCANAAAATGGGVEDFSSTVKDCTGPESRPRKKVEPRRIKGNNPDRL